MTDNNLSISIDAAKTIGLSEAALLETIQKVIKTTGVHELSLEQMLEETPFWSLSELKQILQNLRKKGLIENLTDKNKFVLVSAKKKDISTTELHNVLENRKEFLLEKKWLPDNALIDQTNEYGIPKEFVLSQIEEFVFLHREKKELAHSWGIKFLKYVIKKWRNQEISDFKKSKKKPIDQAWFPSEEAMEILTKSGIETSFINEEIPEFILYWNERGDKTDTWNSKFIAHVRRQWAKVQHLINSSEVPLPISADWKPSEDFFDVLSLTEIDKKFAISVIGDFILYWKENGQAHNSWNSKFLQHVKFQWNRERKFTNSEPPEKVSQRISDTWESKPKKNIAEKKSLTKEEIQEKLKSLRKKHQM